MDKYIARQRKKFMSCAGEKVIYKKYGKINGEQGFLFKGNKLICLARSENGLNFVIDNDNRGRERADLVNTIIEELAFDEEIYFKECDLALQEYKARNETPPKEIITPYMIERDKKWERLYKSDLAKSYKTKDEEVWLWERKFYDAPIEDLQAILNVIKER